MNRSSPGQRSDEADRRGLLLRVALILGAGLWAFSPAFHGEWIWDDGPLLVRNGLIHDPAGLWKIWFEPKSMADYLPLKVSVEWFEWRLWHNNTLGYHLVNVGLHLCSALLIWRLFDQLGLKFAWLGGLIFAVHPVTVESVAWISELKNTLSLPPFLLSMSAYLDYDARGKKRDYLLALGLFLVALLGKATMIMFPLVILLHAWWKRGRVRWCDLKASAPFFAVSLVVGLITLGFVHNDVAGGTIPMGGLLSRLACAGLALSFYFSKCVLPVDLMPIYPKWAVDPPSLLQFLPWPLLLGVLFFCWTKRTTWGRHALLGLGFFLVNLAPFLGLTTGSYMNFTWVMDHLLYLPLIGLIGLEVAAMGQIGSLLPRTFRPLGVGGVAFVVALLAWGCHAYAAVFANGEKLWSYAVARNPQAWVAQNNLAAEFMAKGHLAEAIEHYHQALQLNPCPDVYNNLGTALIQAGQLPEAIAEFNASIQLDPFYPSSHDGLGRALLQSNRLPEAMAQFEMSARLNPRFLAAHDDLGVALMQAGRVPEAIAQFEAALRLDPDEPEAHNNLGSLLLQRGKIPEAMGHFAAILKVDPDNAVAHYNMGDCLAQTGRNAEAIEQFNKALQVSPGMAEARYSLGNALIQAGRIPEAIEQYEAALRIDPGEADTHANLGNALLQSGRAPEAIEQYEQALRITPDDTDVRKTLGLALMKEGRTPEAKKQFEAILQRHPQDVDAQKILARIADEEKATQPPR